MDTLQLFFVYAVITILMAPLLVVYGLPFIAIARVFDHFAQLWFKDSTRFVLSCGIASLGIAPMYDEYRSPLPMYVHWLQGDSVGLGLGFVLASFVVTWIVVVLQVRQIQHLRGRHAA
ncbi:MAG: hypothetical protein E6Q78_15800 [Rhodoferax sp.]|nr:MAG: hypothetical protein E6Q78_15800 [Rhodoferax sp.]